MARHYGRILDPIPLKHCLECFSNELAHIVVNALHRIISTELETIAMRVSALNSTSPPLILILHDPIRSIAFLLYSLNATCQA
eukprot:11488053-Ditylum_brightwellii.AAC.1